MKFYRIALITGIFATTLTFLILIKDINWAILPFSQSLFFASTSLLIGGICGLIGIVLLLWQFTLGVRKIAQFFSDDLQWLNSVHRFIGEYGSLLIFTHILLSTYGYFKDLWWIFIPDFSTSFETYATFGKIALLCLLTLWITSVYFRNKMKYRLWYYLHLLSYLILSMAYIHTIEIGTILDSHIFLKTLWYLSAIAFLCISLYRFIIWSGVTSSKYRVVQTELLPGDVMVLTLLCLNRELTPKIGQYLYLQIKRFGESHPFTIFAIDSENKILKFAIKLQGPFTNKLGQLKIGTEVFIEGPYGVFTAEVEDGSPKIIIAGGVGASPFVEFVKKYGNSTTYMFNCNRKLSQAIERTALSNKLGGNYYDFISQEEIHEQNVFNERVSFKRITELVGSSIDLAKTKFLICGSALFIDGIEADLKKNGIKDRNIFIEKFS